MMAIEVPILAKEIAFDVNICLQIKTMPSSPFVKILTVSFADKPDIRFVLKPLKGMDIMETPLLKNTLYDLIQV